MLSVVEALAIGTRHHQAGQLAEAEKLYRQILAAEPDHPRALHQLGILALESRRFDQAADLIARAIRRDRSQAAFHANLGVAYWQLGKKSEAIGCYQTAVKLQGDLAHVHKMLGIALRVQGRDDEAIASLRAALRLKPEDTEARGALGHALHHQNKLADAETCFRRVARSEPCSADAHFNLGDVLQSQEKLEEAEAWYRKALELDSNHADAHNNLGTILIKHNALDEAEQHYQAALRIRPDCAAVFVNYGAVYLARGRLEEAGDCYRKALAADPNAVLARHNLGTILQKQGRLVEALASFQEVLRADPNNALAHIGVGGVLQMQGKLNGAIECCQQAIRIDPRNAEAHNNMGVAWTEQGRRDEAVACFRRAIELQAGYAQAHGNLGTTLQALGRLDEAELHCRRAVELQPSDSALHSNLLYMLNFHPKFDAASIFAEHRAWAARHADPLTVQAAPHANDRTLARRLRVGYVSPHFLAHAVNFFSEPILASHDRARFEVFCYSDVAQSDETTSRLQGYADHWRETIWQSNDQVAELVRRDQIDILVDLTGHISGGNRMLLFARKPAPIQVTYIGYQNTTGMLAMDYRLTDDYADPPGLTDAFHTEKLARLPTTFFCYLPSADAPSVNPLPALANGCVTFGSVNSFNKITPDVLKAWSQILARVPGSRLLLRADMTDSLRQQLGETFAGHGISADRLDLVNRVPRNEYLELIRRVDIALDPFPFNGHTTTCDCLWQGVPVVTLSGQSYASRFGGSGLVTLGLADLVSRTPDEYVGIAVRLAGEIERLKQLRASLRQTMAASPLLDFQTFARNLEAEYRRMWVAWCAG